MRLLRSQTVVAAPRARSSLLAEWDGSSIRSAGDDLRITSVAIKRFRDVDASDAWLEGIGDRSLEQWVCERSAVFARRARELGCPFDENSEVLLERFVLVDQSSDVAGEPGGVTRERVES